VDPRSDIFSFGAMFYEMLTGRRAFQGDTLISTISSVLKDTPPSVHSVRGDVEPALEEIVNRCLEKDRGARFCVGNGAGFRTGCDGGASGSLPRAASEISYGRRVVLALIGAGGWWGIRQRRVQWVRSYAIPRIYRLFGDSQYLASFQLAMEARQVLPGDPALEQAIASCCPVYPVQSDPPGARVYYRPYLEPTALERLLGQTPLTGRCQSQFYACAWRRKGMKTQKALWNSGLPRSSFWMSRALGPQAW